MSFLADCTGWGNSVGDLSVCFFGAEGWTVQGRFCWAEWWCCHKKHLGSWGITWTQTTWIGMHGLVAVSQTWTRPLVTRINRLKECFFLTCFDDISYGSSQISGIEIREKPTESDTWTIKEAVRGRWKSDRRPWYTMTMIKWSFILSFDVLFLKHVNSECISQLKEFCFVHLLRI